MEPIENTQESMLASLVDLFGNVYKFVDSTCPSAHHHVIASQHLKTAELFLADAIRTTIVPQAPAEPSGEARRSMLNDLPDPSTAKPTAPGSSGFTEAGFPKQTDPHDIPPEAQNVFDTGMTEYGRIVGYDLPRKNQAKDVTPDPVNRSHDIPPEGPTPVVCDPTPFTILDESFKNVDTFEDDYFESEEEAGVMPAPQSDSSTHKDEFRSTPDYEVTEGL